MNTKQREGTAAFIREYRSNEGNFERLYQKLEEELAGSRDDEAYRDALMEIKEKWSKEYQTQKEKAGSAWPEFEKFVSEFEKAVLEAAKAA